MIRRPRQLPFMENELPLPVELNAQDTPIGLNPMRMVTMPSPAQFPCREVRKSASSATATPGMRHAKSMAAIGVNIDMGVNLEPTLEINVDPQVRFPFHGAGMARSRRRFGRPSRILAVLCLIHSAVVRCEWKNGPK